MNRLKKSDMNACTVQLWYNKQRVKRSGSVSLYIQLITRKESIELPLKIEWPLKAIDLKKRELVQRMPNDPDLLAFTSIVEREKAKYWDIIRRFLIKGVEFTLTDIIKESKIYASGTMICEFMEQSIRARQKAPKLRERIKASTAEIHKVGLGWLRNFLKGGDYPIAQIDADWLEAFADHMRPHMHENSVYVKIANVKSYLTYASNHRVAVNQDYKRFKVYSEEPDLNPIDEQEFGRLLALYDDVEKIGPHRPALRAFLFACFTGLRISDLKRFNSKWLCDGGFTFHPVKRRLSNHTPKPLFIPLIPIAEQFVKNIGDGNLGLPSEQEYNRQLKEIAAKADITKRITSHTARHTFGTNLALRNIPLTVIANLMGHKNTNTTMRYINIAEQAKIKAMFALQNHFAGDK